MATGQWWEALDPSPRAAARRIRDREARVEALEAKLAAAREDRDEAILRGTERGLSMQQLVRLLGVRQQSVYAAKKRARLRREKGTEA